MTDPDPSQLRRALRDMFMQEMGLDDEISREGPRQDSSSLHPVLDGDALALPRHPQRIGRYRILECIGEGASARVYRAVHDELQKVVALKVLAKRGGETHAHRERFRREAVTVARLQHPNIIGVHDVGTDGARQFIAMDLIEGGTLAEWLQSEPPVEARLKVMEKIARAVDYAHEHGVLHRDLKPQNVLMTRTLDPVVADFGLARELGDMTMTRQGDILGTPVYMAPEQLIGDHQAVDARADGYALGIMLYEALTGMRPFKGNAIATILEQIRDRNILPPDSKTLGLPSGSDRVCMRSIDPDPRMRYPSAATFADDLACLAAGVAPKSGRAPLRDRIRRTMTRNRAAIAVGFVVLASSGAALHLVEQEREVQWLSLAHRTQSDYGMIQPRVDAIVARAEAARYLPNDLLTRAAIVNDLEETLSTQDDQTGCSDATRGYVLFLLQDHEGSRIAFESGRRNHPENPILSLTQARCYLRAYAERIEWPSASGVSLFPGSQPFHSLELQETAEMTRLRDQARSELDKARGSPLFEKLPTIAWLADLTDAYQRFSDGDLEGSIALLSSLNSLPEAGYECGLLLSIAHCRSGHYNDAIGTARKLVLERPDLQPALELLAACYQHVAYQKLAAREDPRDDLREALRWCASAPDQSRVRSTTASLAHTLGSQALLSGDRDEAQAQFERALDGFDELAQEAPDDFRHFANRATTRLMLSESLTHDLSLPQIELALNDFDRAMELSRGHHLVRRGRVQAHVAAIRVRLRHGSLTQAHIDAAYATQSDSERGLEPDGATLYTRASLTILDGALRISQGQDATESFERAAQIADRAAALEPRFLEARLLGATARVQLAPSMPASEVVAVAHEYRKLRRAGVAKALSSVQVARWLEKLARERENPEARTLTDAAISEWREAFRVAENDPAKTLQIAAQLNDLAWRTVRAIDAEPADCGRAADRLRLALEFTPETGAILNTLGVALFRSGENTDAITTLRRADALNRRSFPSGHPVDAGFLALAVLRSGDREASSALRLAFDELASLAEFSKDPEVLALGDEVQRAFDGE